MFFESKMEKRFKFMRGTVVHGCTGLNRDVYANYRGTICVYIKSMNFEDKNDILRSESKETEKSPCYCNIPQMYSGEKTMIIIIINIIDRRFSLTLRVFFSWISCLSSMFCQTLIRTLHRVSKVTDE